MIRRATPDDYPAISKILSDEGIPLDEQMHDKWATWVYDRDGVIGSYTVNVVHSRPHLQHFCVRRDSRHPTIVREMIRHFIAWCIDNGQDKAYVHAGKSKPDVKKAIEYYFKAKPYAETEKKYWYFLTIRGNE